MVTYNTGTETEGSSYEPNWGGKKEVDHEGELHLQHVNIRNNGNETYRHQRCQTCGNSMIQHNENPSLTCHQCKMLERNDTKYPINKRQHGYEQQGRDDEEEYSRIPIAGEADSDYEYDIFEDLYSDTYSQSSKDDGKQRNVNKHATNYVAYAIAPNVPRRIANKTRSQPLALSNLYHHLYLEDEETPTRQTSPKRWQGHLMRFQRFQLKMGYKRLTKTRTRLMQQIRKDFMAKEKHETSYLRMQTQTQELRVAFPQMRQKTQPTNFVTDKASGRRQSTHLDTVVREKRPVPTITDYRKMTTSRVRPSPQIQRALGSIPNKQTRNKEYDESFFPKPKEYTPLPETWLEFQKQQPQYLHHPIWDLCSPVEFYKWTEKWDWTPEMGHQPTAAMRKQEWLTDLYIQQNMNTVSCDDKEEENKKKSVRTTKKWTPQ